MKSGLLVFLLLLLLSFSHLTAMEERNKEGENLNTPPSKYFIPTSSNEYVSILDLPPEIIKIIFSYFDIFTLLDLSLTCKFMKVNAYARSIPFFGKLVKFENKEELKKIRKSIEKEEDQKLSKVLGNPFRPINPQVPKQFISKSRRYHILPPTLFSFLDLKELNLSNTFLSHPEKTISFIPSQIGNLTCLQKLSFAFNGLAYISPKIGNLVNLTEINFRSNNLPRLPHEMKKLTQLQILNLNFNPFIEFPIHLPVSLRKLNLSTTNISEIPETIEKFINLEKLTISFNNLNFLPNSFAKLTTLKMLDLSGNRFSEIPSQVFLLTNLENLQFWMQKHPIKVSSRIVKLQKLKKLSLSYNQITRPPLLSIDSMPCLEILELENVPLTSETKEELIKISNKRLKNKEKEVHISF